MSNPNDNTSSEGYTLGGGRISEPLPPSWNLPNQPTRIGRIGANSARAPATSSERSRGRTSNFATLNDLSNSSVAPLGGFGGHGASDDEDDGGPERSDRDTGTSENWYAGGERSGLSVENPDHPNRLGSHAVRDILRKAAEAATAPQSAAPSAGPFRGSGYTLGSDEVNSLYIPDPNAQNETSGEQEVAIRHITFWRNGFSVEEGPLMRYDQPENEQLLDEVNDGHAPPQFLNVNVGQHVELRVSRRMSEDYVPPPPRPLAAFEGQGHRLGSVVAEVAVGPAVPQSSASQESPGRLSSSPSREESTMKFQVDQTLPTTSVQIRFADGTRLVARMNLHHTVGDIRNLINASRPGSSSTSYRLHIPFPPRILDDDSLTIEQGRLMNSVVVQRMA